MEAVKINLNHDETQGCKAKALASSVFVLYIVINVQMLLNCEWGPKCRLPEIAFAERGRKLLILENLSNACPPLFSTSTLLGNET